MTQNVLLSNSDKTDILIIGPNVTSRLSWSLHFQVECRLLFQSVFSLMSWLLVEFSLAPSLVNCVHLSRTLFVHQLPGNPHLAIRFNWFLALFLWVWILVCDYSISLLI